MLATRAEMARQGTYQLSHWTAQSQSSPLLADTLKLKHLLVTLQHCTNQIRQLPGFLVNPSSCYDNIHGSQGGKSILIDMYVSLE